MLIAFFMLCCATCAENIGHSYRNLTSVLSEFLFYTRQRIMLSVRVLKTRFSSTIFPFVTQFVFEIKFSKHRTFAFLSEYNDVHVHN